MKEIESILKLYRQSLSDGIGMALATVVNKFGSAYRRPGARMLITSNGKFAGTISGGCIERDLLERSSEFCAIDSPQLLTYKAENGDPYDFGSGCEGIIYTLVEPLNHLGSKSHKQDLGLFGPEQFAQAGQNGVLNPVEILEIVYSSRLTVHSATVFSAPEKMQEMVGKRIVRFQNGEVAIGGNSDNSVLSIEIMLASTKLSSSCPAFTSLLKTADGSFGVFFEKIEPPVRLMIFGAGDDAMPLSSIAHATGLKHSIIDHRPGLLTESRFPFAESLLKLHPEQYGTRLIFDQFTACVVMNHHFDRDRAAVQFLLEQTSVLYIGVLGPKKRALRMLAEMQFADRFENMVARQSSLFAPIGLDIGAETPEEIALSIIAEIKAFYRNKTALLLRDKAGPIHDAFDGAGDKLDSAFSPSDAEAQVNVSKELFSAFDHVPAQCKI